MKGLLLCALVAIFGQSLGQLNPADPLGRWIMPGNPSWQQPQSWMNIRSEEIDSREHGVRPGKRSTTCPCGGANRSGNRIVGGREYAAHEYPFIAGICTLSPLRPFCGGTIISATHVVTAAHCTDDHIGRNAIGVIVGDYDRARAPAPSTRIVPVSAVAQHQGYNKRTLANDISILILQSPLQFTREVQPACLPPDNLNIQNKYIRVIGWGAMTNQGAMTMKPRKVDLRVIDTNQCAAAWQGLVPINNKHMCTHSKRKTACQGDSGGPVIWVDPDTNRYTLVGAVSFGAECATGKPSVQTDISAHLQWIRSVLASNNQAGSRTCTKL